jgi:hypothetical protein
LYLSFPPNYIVIKSIILVSKQRASTNFHRQTIECLFPNSPEVFCCEPLYFRKNFRNAFPNAIWLFSLVEGKFWIVTCMHEVLFYSWVFINWNILGILTIFAKFLQLSRLGGGMHRLIWDTGEYSGIYRSNKVKYY